MPAKFIPIEWSIDRNDGYVNIDCIKKVQNKKIPKSECCDESIIGCNLEACGYDPDEAIYIQVFDKYHNLLAQSKWENNVNRIIIDKDSLGQIIIKIE